MGIPLIDGGLKTKKMPVHVSVLLHVAALSSYKWAFSLRLLLIEVMDFYGLSLQLLKLLHKCDDRFHFYSRSAVHISDLYCMQF